MLIDCYGPFFELDTLSSEDKVVGSLAIDPDG